MNTSHIPQNKQISIYRSINNSMINLTSYVGLVNQKNTCYLNSIIQTLFFTLPFRYKILSFDENNLRLNLTSIELRKLFIHLMFQISNTITTNFLTDTFCWNYKLLHDQQDIQEFLRIFLDAISENLPELNLMFEGHQKSIIICFECKNESICLSKFMDIQLPIIKKEFTSVHDLLQEYTKYDILTHENMYYCNVCNKYINNCLKSISFFELPKILVLQLNRIVYDREIQNKIKVYNNVMINDILNIDTCVYKLYSIIVHLGDSISGHYLCYLFSFETGKWYLFNDNQVIEIKLNSLIEIINQNAYLLFYQKLTIQDKRFNSINNNLLDFNYIENEKIFSLQINNISLYSDIYYISKLYDEIFIRFIYNSVIKSIKIDKKEKINKIFQLLVNGYDINYINTRTRNSQSNIINYKDYISIWKYSYCSNGGIQFDKLLINEDDEIYSYDNYFLSHEIFTFSIKKISNIKSKSLTENIIPLHKTNDNFIFIVQDKKHINNKHQYSLYDLSNLSLYNISNYFYRVYFFNDNIIHINNNNVIKIDNLIPYCYYYISDNLSVNNLSKNNLLKLYPSPNIININLEEQYNSVKIFLQNNNILKISQDDLYKILNLNQNYIIKFCLIINNDISKIIYMSIKDLTYDCFISRILEFNFEMINIFYLFFLDNKQFILRKIICEEYFTDFINNSNILYVELVKQNEKNRSIKNLFSKLSCEKNALIFNNKNIMYGIHFFNRIRFNSIIDNDSSFETEIEKIINIETNERIDLFNNIFTCFGIDKDNSIIFIKSKNQKLKFEYEINDFLIILNYLREIKNLKSEDLINFNKNFYANKNEVLIIE